MFPFKQKKINKNTILRVFSENVDANELVWHRDRNDRLIEVISGDGWYIQLENRIPQKLTEGSTFSISAGEYHRVIKGNGDLLVKIQEMRAHPRSGDLKQPRPGETEFPAVVGYSINGEPQSEIVYNDEELTQVLDYLAPLTGRGEQIPYSIDSLSDVEASDIPVGAEIEQYMEGKDQNKDGDNDFDDVKIARMKASGMSDKEIKEKHPELFENKKSNHDPNYGAPEGSKRDKQLDQTQADLKKAKKLRKDGKAKQAKELEQRAYRRRDRMEKKEREKKSFKNKPRKDTKKESVRRTESQIRAMIRDVLVEELSKKTKATLRKKAEKKGYTAGSVEKEYKKGLAAFASSGSRKGMTAHQWAMARVNSATPSKSWAVVKKSKAKKK